MTALLPTLCFSSLLASTNVSNCEIKKNQRIHEDYILRVNPSSDQLIFDGRAKRKLPMLAFLYCGEIVKNSHDLLCESG